MKPRQKQKFPSKDITKIHDVLENMNEEEYESEIK